jgi:hypothetical protein
VPLRALGGTALVTAVTWGAYEWASSTGHSTIGMIAGIALVPAGIAFGGVAAYTLSVLVRRAVSSAAARKRERDEDGRGGSSPGARTREDLGLTRTRRKRVAA